MQKNTENTRKLQPHEYMYFGSQRVFDYVKNTILNGTPNEQRKMYNNLSEIVYHDVALDFKEYGSFAKVLYYNRLLPLANHELEGKSYGEINKDYAGLNDFLAFANIVAEKIRTDLPNYLMSEKSVDDISRNAYLKVVCQNAKNDFYVKRKRSGFNITDSIEEKTKDLGESFYYRTLDEDEKKKEQHKLELEENIIDCLVQLCSRPMLSADKIIAFAYSHAITRIDNRKNSANKDIVEQFGNKTYFECAQIFINHLQAEFDYSFDVSRFDCLFDKLDKESNGEKIGERRFGLTADQIRHSMYHIKDVIPALNVDVEERTSSVAFMTNELSKLPKKVQNEYAWLVSFSSILEEKIEVSKLLQKAILKSHKELPLEGKRPFISDDDILRQYESLTLGEAFNNLTDFICAMIYHVSIPTGFYYRFTARLNEYDKDENCIVYNKKFIIE